MGISGHPPTEAPPGHKFADKRISRFFGYPFFCFLRFFGHPPSKLPGFNSGSGSGSGSGMFKGQGSSSSHNVGSMDVPSVAASESCLLFQDNHKYLELALA
jgi:hypothetical protein